MTVNNFFKLTFVFIVSIFLFTACQKENGLQEIVDNNETAAKSRNAESCYTLIFPVTILFPDGGRERIYNQIELNEFLEEWEDWYEGEGAPSLRFPVTVQLPNGSRERIRNQRQWDALVASCDSSNEEEPTSGDGVGEPNDDTIGEIDNSGNNTEEEVENTGSNNTGDVVSSNGNSTAPAASWFTAHRGSQEESHGHYIMTCSDGGYLQVGETGFIPNSAKILVVKTDSQGNLLWRKEFGSRGHNLGNSALETTDGYLIAGALNQNSALIKLNKTNGQTLFQKTYNNGGSDAIEHIALTPNGIAAIGYIQAADPNNTFFTEGQGFFFTLDTQGNKLSSKNLNAYTAHAYRIKAYQNEFIVSGLTAEAQDYTVLKMDAAGNVRWHKTYGGSSSDHCFGLDLGSDGSIFLTGHTLSGTQNWDTYTMKLNSNGDLLWEQKKGNPRGFDPRYIHDEAWGIKATSDGGCVVVAGTGDEYSYSACNATVCSDNWEVYLIKYDASGNLQWQTTYAMEAESDWAGEDIDLTTDGGAIIGVDNGQFGFLKIAPF